MTTASARQMALRLKGLLPTTTEEQVRDWMHRFAPFEFDVAVKVLDRYVERFEELRTPVLIEMLRGEAARAGGAVEDKARAAARAEAEAVKAQWVVIDAALDALTADEFEAVRQRVLAKQPSPRAREIVARVCPKTSLAVRAMMALELGICRSAQPAEGEGAAR